MGPESVLCPLHARRFSLVTGTADSGDCGVAVHRVAVEDGGLVLLL